MSLAVDVDYYSGAFILGAIPDSLEHPRRGHKGLPGFYLKGKDRMFNVLAGEYPYSLPAYPLCHFTLGSFTAVTITQFLPSFSALRFVRSNLT